MDFRNPLAVVTPTLDGPVLATLALADTHFTTGQLARMLPYSDEGIRRVLKRLVGQGIVHRDNVGPVVAYRLNRDHLACAPIEELARLSNRLLQAIEDEIAAWSVHPEYAAVFGSVARRSASENSDVDVLVVKPLEDMPDEWESQLEELEAAIARWTGNDGRVLEMTVDEVNQHQPVIQDVIREGFTVFGTPAWLRRQINREP